MAASSMKDIKNRIKSVSGTSKITKAMELVATSKLRHAKEKALLVFPYFEILKNTLGDIAKNNRDFSSVYTKKRETDKKCFVVIAGDRGLAGGYNINLLKKVMSEAGERNVVFPIGRKANEFFSKNEELVIKNNYHITEAVDIGDCDEIGHILSEEFKKGTFDELYISYTEFVSVLTQEPKTEKVLPILIENKEEKSREMTIYETGAESVFEKIVPGYISGMIYGAVLKAQASEFAARRSAMENANRNAAEMIDSLNLSYNRARQAVITQELTEIVSGAEALK